MAAIKKPKAIDSGLRSDLINYCMVGIVYAVLLALQSCGLLKSSLQGQLVPICAYIVMAVSLNLTVGIMGELSLGHAGFMSVGAFSGVVVAGVLKNAIPLGIMRLAVSMLAGGLIAGVVSLIIVIPVLRLRGDYLAIVTLAFGEIIKNIVNCLYVGIDSAGIHASLVSEAALGLEAKGSVILRGPMGAVGVSKLSTLTAGFILILITLFVAQNLVGSRTGRAVMALRDNLIAAESIGISPVKYKIAAFVTSAVMAGMAGALYAMNYSTVLAKKFDFNTSVLVLVFVVLGGMGNIRGSVIAAAALTVLPELLREFSNYRMMVYAIVLILVMLITNNPTIKNLFSNIKDRLKGRGEAIENEH